MKIDKNYSRRFHLLTTLSPTPAVRPRRFCCLKMALTVLTLVSIKIMKKLPNPLTPILYVLQEPQPLYKVFDMQYSGSEQE